MSSKFEFNGSFTYLPDPQEYRPEPLEDVGRMATVATGLAGGAGVGGGLVVPVMITAVAAGVLAMFAHSLGKMTPEEYARERTVAAGAHAEAMAIAEGRRKGLPEAGYWRAREIEEAGGVEAYRAAHPEEFKQEITVNVDANFQFDGTLSSTEEARIMEQWSAEVDTSFENVARKVGAKYRR